MADQTDTALGSLRGVVGEGVHSDRRLGRALAFQALYEADLSGHPVADILARLATPLAQEGAESPYTTEALQAASGYARELIAGVRLRRGEIDGVIQARAPAWPLVQMSAVDRNVLRLGLYESLFGGAKVPQKAAINEAVELAKMFGSETSGRFVNGVLGRAVEADARHEAPPVAPERGRDERDSASADADAEQNQNSMEGR